MKRIFAIVTALTLLVATAIPSSAADLPSAKQEVVYGILNLDGSVNNLYVVNIFDGGAIRDYGSYLGVRNLTTSEEISQSGDLITIDTNADRLYYQGTLGNKDLPWDVAIRYFLDGKEIAGQELAGRSGKLRINLSVKQNNKVNRSFFEDYALQVALTLDNKLCSNIEAENATVAEAGGKKQLAYTVLPGNGIETDITADVRNFEMDAITLNGIRLALGMAVDSDQFTEQIAELVQAIKGLDEGAAELLDGLNRLAGGMQKYVDGMQAFNAGLGQFANGTNQLHAGAAALSDGLSQLTTQNDVLVSGALAIQQATFASVNAELAKRGVQLPVLTPENYTTVLSAIPQLAPVKAQLDGAVQFTQGLKGYVGGVAQLGQGAAELANGTAELQASSSVLAASANELYNAAAELNAAMQQLRDGLTAYKNGTKQLRDGTSSMGSQIQAQIDQMLGGISGQGGKVVSFVSEKNTNVSAVQFVLKTEEVVLPATPPAAPPSPVRLSFWQKLLKLFGLYDQA